MMKKHDNEGYDKGIKMMKKHDKIHKNDKEKRSVTFSR